MDLVDRGRPLAQLRPRLAGVMQGLPSSLAISPVSLSIQATRPQLASQLKQVVGTSGSVRSTGRPGLGVVRHDVPGRPDRGRRRALAGGGRRQRRSSGTSSSGQRDGLAGSDEGVLVGGEAAQRATIDGDGSRPVGAAPARARREDREHDAAPPQHRGPEAAAAGPGSSPHGQLDVAGAGGRCSTAISPRWASSPRRAHRTASGRGDRHEHVGEAERRGAGGDRLGQQHAAAAAASATGRGLRTGRTGRRCSRRSPPPATPRVAASTSMALAAASSPATNQAATRPREGEDDGARARATTTSWAA